MQQPRRRCAACRASAHLVQHRALIGASDDNARRRVVEERREAGSGQQRRQRHHDGAELGAGPIDGEEIEAIGQHGRDALAAPDAERRQRVGAPVEIGIELAPRQPDFVFIASTRRDDDGGVVRPVACVVRGQRTHYEAGGGDGRFHGRLRSVCACRFLQPVPAIDHAEPGPGNRVRFRERQHFEQFSHFGRRQELLRRRRRPNVRH